MDGKRLASGYYRFCVAAIYEDDNMVRIHTFKAQVDGGSVETRDTWLRIRETEPTCPITCDFAVTTQVEKEEVERSTG